MVNAIIQIKSLVRKERYTAYGVQFDKFTEQAIQDIGIGFGQNKVRRDGLLETIMLCKGNKPPGGIILPE